MSEQTLVELTNSYSSWLIWQFIAVECSELLFLIPSNLTSIYLIFKWSNNWFTVTYSPINKKEALDFQKYTNSIKLSWLQILKFLSITIKTLFHCLVPHSKDLLGIFLERTISPCLMHCNNTIKAYKFNVVQYKKRIYLALERWYIQLTQGLVNWCIRLIL